MNETKENKKIFRNKKRAIIWIIVAILATIGGITYYIFFDKNITDDKKDNVKENKEVKQELTPYKCLSGSCLYDESLVEDLNIILVLEEGKVFTYNMLTKEIINHDLTGEIHEAKFAYFNDGNETGKINEGDVYGLYIQFGDGTKNFYSFDNNEYVLKKNVDFVGAGSQDAALKFGFIYIESYKDLSSSIIRLSDGMVLKTIDILSDNRYGFDIAYSGEYYWHLIRDYNTYGSLIKFIDKEYNYVNDSFIFYYSVVCLNYAISSIDGSLVLPNKETFSGNHDDYEFNSFNVYNNEGKLIRTSKDYREIVIITNNPNGYILVEDGSNYKLITPTEANIIDITKSTDTKNVTGFNDTTHVMGSLDISVPKTAPEDIIINIRDSAITSEDFKKYNPDAGFTEQEIAQSKNCKYYTYYFNNKVGTITKTGPNIGGCYE